MEYRKLHLFGCFGFPSQPASANGEKAIYLFANILNMKLLAHLYNDFPHGVCNAVFNLFRLGRIVILEVCFNTLCEFGGQISHLNRKPESVLTHQHSKSKFLFLHFPIRGTRRAHRQAATCNRADLFNNLRVSIEFGPIEEFLIRFLPHKQHNESTNCSSDEGTKKSHNSTACGRVHAESVAPDSLFLKTEEVLWDA